jgi:tetratricopeptide (TPR) repeat protein
MSPSNSSLRTELSRTFCLAACLFTASAALAQRRIDSIPTAQSPEQLVTLGGWVHADYGQSLPTGVTIHLETDEGMPAREQPVDSSGYFEFVGLTRTSYRVIVSAPGFQSYHKDVDLRVVGNRLNINVQLSPANKSKLVLPATSPSFTDNKASRKARKEYEKGDQALQQGNLSEAQSHLEKSVNEYPCYARAQTALAVVRSEQRQFSGSETALKKAMECDPDFLDAYTELGQLYYDENRYQDSVAVLQQGARRSPGSWQFHYQLGASDYSLRQYAEAEQEYVRAESLNSLVPAEIHVKLADVYLKEAAYQKAYAEMQAYLRAEPNGRFAAKLRNVMQRMQADQTVQPDPPAATQSAGPRQ